MGLQAIVERLQGFWGRLGPTQRVFTVGLGLFAVAALAYLGIWAQAPEYTVAYRGLAEADAADIVDALVTAGIPYRLDASGSTIRVPAAQVAEARLEVARQGLPKAASTGFEILDGSQFDQIGMTEEARRVAFLRALAGELERTIVALDSVEMARVHIVQPEPTLFLEDETPPTASVLLQLSRSAQIDRGQIQAITHLVASSVEGLEASAVTVVDVQGHILSSGEEDVGMLATEATASQLETKQQYEHNLEKRLLRMLEDIVGPGKAVTQVSATFNWDRVETTSEIWSPTGDEPGAVRSSQTVEEQRVGTETAEGGAPGADTNTPGTTPTYPNLLPENAPPGSSISRSTTNNYEPSRTVETKVNTPGVLSRLSVAVVVDESVAPATVVSLQAMVSAAVGFDATRGDALVVERVLFDTSVIDEQRREFAAQQQREFLLMVGKTVAAVVGLVLVLLFARSLFRDLSRHVLPQPIIREVGLEALPAGATAGAGGVELIPAPVRAATPPQMLPAGQVASAYQAASAAVSQKAEDDQPLDREFIDPKELERLTMDSLEARFKDEDTRRRMRRQREAILLARKNPELVANALQAWLNS